MLAVSSGRLSFNKEGGLLVAYADTDVAATDLLIDGSWSAMPELKGGLGISVELGARLQLQRARLSKTWRVALACTGTGTRVDASELLIDGTLPDQGSSGPGLRVAEGATLVVANARLSGNGGAGLEATGLGTRVDASGLLVDDSLGGVSVTTGADLLLTAARLSGNRGAGILASDIGSTVGAVGLPIDGTLPQSGDLQFGRGIGVQDGATLSLTGSRLSGNREVGLTGRGSCR